MSQPAAPETLIDVRGLTKYYADRPAVRELTFSVPRGQVLGFLGPNGAGKSTTMRILTGFISASEGTASIGGYDVFRDSLEVRRRVGYLPETTPLYTEMRVADYLATMATLHGVPPRLRAARLDYALAACGLEDRRREVVGRLSRGLKQRVGLAQAVVHDPDVLILDEPTAGLDPGQTRETRELIRTLGRQHTVILSSHILPEVAMTCERVLIISGGRLVADGTPEELGRRSRDRATEVEMIVRGEPEAIRRRLQRLARVERVEVAGAGEGQCRVVVETGREDLREELARAMVNARFGLRELRSRELSLEDVFLQLTSEEPA